MKFSMGGKVSKYGFMIKFVIPFMVVAVIGAVFGVKLWYSNSLKPVDATDASQISFKIEFGDSVSQIADSLAEVQIIKSPVAFVWYVRGDEAGVSLQAGSYTVSPSMSVPVLVSLFSEGQIDSTLVTISSGKRLDETVTELINVGWNSVDVATALNISNYDHPLLNNLPPDTTLEGYLYPDSYEINDNTTPEDLIESMLNNFYDKITERNLVDKLSDKGFTLHEAITLASIIQKESGKVEDQAQVSQVFQKRLAEGIMMGSDVTFLYAAAVTGQEATVNLDSPYNTRLYVGLPPGPISNFTITALEAVASPAEGAFLYFVAGDDGNVYFSKTLEEHNVNTAKYCIELCALP